MENLFESLVSLEERLHRAGISCAVIGGVAVGVWGEPRVTRDVDVKVLLGRNHTSRRCRKCCPPAGKYAG